MREILFRGKRVIDGKWVESCCPLGEMHSGTITHDFISETVCQYTGLTDKNGRKIFEGDILRSDENKVGQVQWFEEHSAFMIWNNTENKVHFLYDNDFSKIEVIGNIFDNPELVK